MAPGVQDLKSLSPETVLHPKGHLPQAQARQPPAVIGHEPPPLLPAPPEQLRFGDLLLDVTRHEVYRGETLLHLTPKEYELLHYLASHRGQMLTQERILEEVWGWEFAGGTRTVDVHIRWLREKLEEDPAAPQRIVTVRGSGYRFEG